VAASTARMQPTALQFFRLNLLFLVLDSDPEVYRLGISKLNEFSPFSRGHVRLPRVQLPRNSYTW
jgi:hypothetical protein